MKKISSPILVGFVSLILLSSACTVLGESTTTPVGTILSGNNLLTSTSISSVTATATDTPITPVIPITGENVVEMQCQFCVNELTHAVFVFPDYAIFDVDSASPVTCLTAEVINGKRVLVCSGAQLTSFNLKICSDASNCLLYPVALQGCPLVPDAGTASLTSTPATPIFLTAINTLQAATPTRSQNNTAPTPTPTPQATSTSVAPAPTGILPTIPILTTVVPATPTEQAQPTATDEPPPTPVPPTPVPVTVASTDDHHRPPTKTPHAHP